MKLFNGKGLMALALFSALFPTSVEANDDINKSVNRSGVYIGADVGYSWTDNKLVLIRNNNDHGDESENFNGAIFFGHRWGKDTGYFEVESAFRFRERKGIRRCSNRQNCRTNIGNSLEVRAALGINLNEHASIYGFGGVAVADVESLRIHTGLRGNGTINPANVGRITFDGSGVMVGYTVGGGYAHELGNGYSIRLEGAYTDFGTDRKLTNPPTQNIMEFGFSEVRINIGLIKRF